MQIRYLDGRRFRRALLAACDHGQRQRAELNRINVFPVADGDTGTNLALTLQAIADRVRMGGGRPELHAVAGLAAEAAVVGARGNCGMMLSHFLLGFSEAVERRVRIDTREFGLAMSAGAERLAAAIERPVEGTILTVIRDSAAAARKLAAQDFVPLVTHVVEEARRSLARTPTLLPALRESGVVDAGAKGFVALLEGVLLFVRGGWPQEEDAGQEAEPPVLAAALAEGESAGRFRYCTEALVRGDALPAQDEAREALREAGDSLIVVRAGDVLKVHVHTDEPERVFAYLRSVGSLVTHKAEDMRAQHAAVERAAERHVHLARRPVVVATDSACDLSEEITRAHGIRVVPMTLVEGDRTYRDGIDITPPEFHAKLLAGGELPTTSQPPPGAFLEAYRLALEEGERVVGVHVGSKLSGTLGAAEAAAARLGAGDVLVADSKGVSLLQGLLILKAVELAELGTEPPEIVAEIDRVRARSGLLFTVDTLDRLLASGRVGRGRALLGRMLSIKPVLALRADGSVETVARARGREQARARVLGELRARIPGGARVRFGIVHVAAPELVGPLARELRGTYGEDVEILSAPATPVIATHIGAGAWGVAYLVED